MNRLPQLTLALLLCAASHAAAPQRRPNRPPPDPASDSTAEILTRVLRWGNFAMRADIEEIGRRANEEAFLALRTVVEEFDNRAQLQDAFWALRYFRGTELEPEVIDFVDGQVYGRSAAKCREAAHGLLVFRESANAELHRVLATSKDRFCRAIALTAVLAEIEARGSAEALETILENALLGITAGRVRLLEGLDLFVGEQALDTFERCLRRREVDPFVKTVIVDTLAPRPEVAEVAATGKGPLRAAMRVRHPSVEYRALSWLLDPRGPAPAVYRGEVTRLARSKDASVRRAAGIAAGRIRRSEEPEDDYLAGLRALLRSRHAADRQAACFLLGESGTLAAATHLHELLDDDDRTVVSEALLALVATRRLESVAVLVSGIVQVRGVERHEYAAALRALTGLDNGTNPRRWRGWWDDAGARFVLPSEEELRARAQTLAAQQEAHESEADFFGLPILSERVAFLLDVSGSMVFEVEDGFTRFDLARRELRQVLRRLPDSTLVNVIFFSSEVEAWRDGLVELDERSRPQLEEFIAAAEPHGYTNLYDALELSVLDRRIDTVFVLTDGVPEGGATADPAQILLETQRWNSTGHVTIHGVSVAGENQLVRDLARLTGGAYLVAR